MIERASACADDSARVSSAAPLQPMAYTIEHGCKLLSISRSHVYQLASKGLIRLIKVGNRTLIPRSEIERLVA